MTVLWTTTELPAAAFDPEPDDDQDDDSGPWCHYSNDLWGQGITAHQARTAALINPPARYL